MVVLAEIFARRLQIDQQRNGVADRLPVVIVERDSEVARDRVEMDGCVGRPADRRVDHDGVLERLAGHDVGGLEVLSDHLHDAPAGMVGDLAALAIGCGNGGGTRKLHAQRLRQRVHRRRSAHRVAVTDRRRRRGDPVHELVIVDLARRQELARFPYDGAGAGALALVPAIEHRADRQRDCRNVDGRGTHQQSRRGLVAADGQHNAVERIAVEHLDQRKIGQVAVERRGRALAGFLDRMAGELERQTAGGHDALAHALGKLDVVAVAGRQVRTRLRYPDDRLARLQLLAGQSVIEITLEIERRHARIGRVVEPLLRSKFRGGLGAAHIILQKTPDDRVSAVTRQAYGPVLSLVEWTFDPA